jgi:E3 ubiquitin-protein ligase SspH2
MEAIEEAISEWMINQDPNEWIYLTDIKDEDIGKLPRNLKRLAIEGCKDKVNLKNFPDLRLLKIRSCSVGVLELPRSLRYLYMNDIKLDILNNIPNIMILNILNCGYINIGKLPFTLEDLTLINVSIDTLPELPPNLEILDIQETPIKVLDNLPNTLTYLYINDSSVEYINELPPSLVELHIHRTMIQMLPELPPQLEVLDCGKSMLRSIPKLPNGFKELYCARTPFLRTLPCFPEGMTILSAYKNEQLESLPKLPSTLKELYIHNTSIGLLNDMPDSLTVLEAHDCPYLPIEVGQGEKPREYNRRLEEFFKDGAMKKCKAIKEELLDLTWGPDRIVYYINKYGISVLESLH